MRLSTLQLLVATGLNVRQVWGLVGVSPAWARALHIGQRIAGGSDARASSLQAGAAGIWQAKPASSCTMMTSTARATDGLIFTRDEENPGRFDSSAIGMPRIHRYMHEATDGSRWVMWYHGRNPDLEKEKGLMDIGTGRIGQATSTDGIYWTRTEGQSTGGAVLDVNTEQWWGFDTAHIGLGDVTIGASDRVQADSGVYFMYYFGGNFAETDVTAEFGLEKSPSKSKGVRMRIGVALSQDGINWCRIEGEHADGCCLDVGQPGEFDELFVGWPQVSNYRGEEFRMYYHSLDPRTKKYTVGLASSQDGLLWKKLGPVFAGGREGCFDELGASRRHVLKIKNLYYMFYEGVNKAGRHAIGLARSENGRDWVRVQDQPVLEPAEPDSGLWDSGGVTSPHVVQLGDGRYRLYYVGVSKDGSSTGASTGNLLRGIGIAEASVDDLTKWEKVVIPQR